MFGEPEQQAWCRGVVLFTIYSGITYIKLWGRQMAHGTWYIGTWHIGTWHIQTWHIRTWHKFKMSLKGHFSVKVFEFFSIFVISFYEYFVHVVPNIRSGRESSPTACGLHTYVPRVQAEKRRADARHRLKTFGQCASLCTHRGA